MTGLAGTVLALVALLGGSPAAAAAVPPGAHSAPYSGDRTVGGSLALGPSTVGCHAWLRALVAPSVNATTGDAAVWLRSVAEWCGSGVTNASWTSENLVLGLEGWAFKAHASTVSAGASWTLTWRAHAIIAPANSTAYSRVLVTVTTRLVDTTTGAWVNATNASAGAVVVTDTAAANPVGFATAAGIGASYGTSASYAVTPGTVYVVWTAVEISIVTWSGGVGDWALAEFNLGSAGFGGGLVGVTTP